MHGMNETALTHFHGLLDELVDGVDCVIFLVEDLRNGVDSTFSYFSVQ